MMEASPNDSQSQGSTEPFFGLGRLLRLGGHLAQNGLGTADPEPCPPNAHEAPTGASEVTKKNSTLTPGKTAAAPQAGPLVNLSITPETLEVLQKLHAAGVINLGSTVVNTDAKLTTWEYHEIKTDMIAVQKLRSTKTDGRESTVGCRLRYLRYLENHPAAPVQLRPPNERSWLDHAAYRMEEEEATGSALNHYRKALKSLLAALRLPVWPSLVKKFEEIPSVWTLPPDELVPRFWEQAVYVEDPTDTLMNETIRHMMHWGFYGGNRPPSELAVLDVEDVRFDERTVVVTEVKKGGKERDTTDIEPFVVNASNGKSLLHYLQHVRPLLAKRSEEKTNAFFLDKNGKRWHPNDLGWALSEAGKQI